MNQIFEIRIFLEIDVDSIELFDESDIPEWYKVIFSIKEKILIFVSLIKVNINFLYLILEKSVSLIPINSLKIQLQNKSLLMENFES